MWGKRRKRCARLPRQLALGRLEDALARVEQQQQEAGEPGPVPYPRASSPAPAAPAARPGLLPADVPVDNSAGPESSPAGQDPAPRQRELPAQRTGDSTRHGSFG
jgi:hypothetical protein